MTAAGQLGQLAKKAPDDVDVILNRVSRKQLLPFEHKV